MTTKSIIKGGVIGGISGALIGSSVPLVKGFLQKRKESTTNNNNNNNKNSQILKQQEEENNQYHIINLKHHPDAKEVISRMADYQNLDREAYQSLVFNMDRLVGLLILTSAEDSTILPDYEIKAHRYQFNIKESLIQLALQYTNGRPSAQFSIDSDLVVKTTDNIMHNLRQMIREKFSQRKVQSV